MGGGNKLYTTLQLTTSADDDTIRRAYKELSERHHPDRNPDDPDAAGRWRALRLAYEVLIDPERRALYDEFGDDSLGAGFDPVARRRELALAEEEAKRRAAAALKPPAPVPPPAPPPATGGGPAPRPPPPRPHYDVMIPIGRKMAREGGVLSTKIMRPIPCSSCGGSGRADRLCKSCRGARKVIAKRLEDCVDCHALGLVGERVSCRACHGTGQRTKNGCRRCGDSGRIVRHSACDTCYGRGFKVIRFEQACSECRTTGYAPCRKCDATGRIPKPTGIKLRIARGTEEGVVYRYAGAGFTSNGDSPADLLVMFELLARAPARRRRRRW